MIYSYRCPKCEVEVTVERSIHDISTDVGCTDCKVPMQRKWDSPPVTFRGKGFYGTGG